MNYYIIERVTDTRRPYFEVASEGDCTGRWVAYISPRCLINHKNTAAWIAEEHHGGVVEVEITKIATPTTKEIGG